MKKTILAAAAAFLLSAVLILPVAQAAEFLVPIEGGDGNIVVPSTQTHKNLYTAGSTVTLEGPTTGDLYAAGGTLVISGNVETDANLAGGTIVLNSDAGGDVRAAGGTININGKVGGDLIVFGGTVTLGDLSAVSGDLIVNGGTVTVNGPVSGAVLINAGTVTVNSALAGSVKIRAHQQLTFGPLARVGTVDHTGPKEATLQDGAQVGTVNFQEKAQREGSRHNWGGILTLTFLLKLLAWLAAALVLLQFVPGRIRAVTDSMHKSPWANLGVGFLALVVTPILAIILLVTVIGYYIALILGVAYAFFLLVSCLAAAIFTGALIVKWLTKKDHLHLDWQAATIGVVVFALLGFIPVVGWLIVAVLSLMAFGGFVRWSREVSRSERT